METKFKKSERWTQEETMRFIKTRMHFDEIFTNKLVDLERAWKDVGTEAEVEFSDWQKLRKKWQNLTAMYRRILIGPFNFSNGITTIPTNWPYFNIFHEFFTSKSKHDGNLTSPDLLIPTEYDENLQNSPILFIDDANEEDIFNQSIISINNKNIFTQQQEGYLENKQLQHQQNLLEKEESPSSSKSPCPTNDSIRTVENLLTPLETKMSINKNSVQIENKRRKKKKSKIVENILRQIKNTLETNEDEFDIIGKLIAFKLRRLPKDVKTISEKFLMDVLYNAEMGSIDKYSTMSFNSNNYNNRS